MKDVIHGDRRKWRRHPYRLELRFTHTDPGGKLRVGYGVTADLSRASLRFWTDEPVELGVELETRIPWPVLLQDVLPLELVLKGSVTAMTGRGAIFAIRSYEFRTCGARSFWEEEEPASIISKVA